MPDIKLQVLSGPTQPKPWLPRGLLFRGESGDTNYLCGSCSQPLAKDLHAGQLIGQGKLQCPACGAVNLGP